MTNLYGLSEHKVSIHAPGRGATPLHYPRQTPTHCFNSRTREGCDLRFKQANASGRSFNSRTREGCDHPDNKRYMRPFGFNSRTREGCDGLVDEMAHAFFVSIHAPGRGATSKTSSTRSTEYRFNSRTREGCD